MALLIGMMMAVAGTALLAKVLRDGIWPPRNSMNRSGESMGRVIELNEYEIVEEDQESRI